MDNSHRSAERDWEVTIGMRRLLWITPSNALERLQNLSYAQPTSMPFADDPDSYLLLLLSDGNLPTGSFVSSSGLESYFKHGFPYIAADPPQLTPNVKPPVQMDTTITFIQDSLSSCAQLSLPFVTDTHLAIEAFRNSPFQTEATLRRLQDLDQLCEVMTLNHVAKRASRAQGVALLTLHSKGFSRPPWLDSLFEGDTLGENNTINGILDTNEQAKLNVLVDAFKLLIRKSDTQGHLPICWGILTGALQLPLGERFPLLR
jgi:urease accessory protein